jgi:hypothetical protein
MGNKIVYNISLQIPSHLINNEKSEESNELVESVPSQNLSIKINLSNEPNEENNILPKETIHSDSVVVFYVAVFVFLMLASFFILF